MKKTKLIPELTSDNIIDLDLYENPNMIVRSNEEIRLERFNKIKSEIRLNKCLTDDTMNYIGEILNNFCNNEYKIQNTIVLSRIPDEVIRVIEKNDIQFLFDPPANLCPVHVKNDKKLKKPICTCENEIGHWICVFYRYITNKVYIYDSLNSTKIVPAIEKTIRVLYPTINIETDIVMRPLNYGST